MRLAGQHAIVTGGGTGIGAAIAAALEAEGAAVSRVGRRPEKLGPNGVAADVTDRAQVDAAFAAARERHGPVAILVNNAGQAGGEPFARISAELWRDRLAVNLDGAFHCCQAALADLLAAERGRIVTIASTAGLRGYAYTAPYVAAKHGAVGLMRALAVEFAKTGLTANAVCPGFTDTDLVAGAIANIQAKTGRSEAEAKAELARLNPSGRLIAPAEIAALVLELVLSERNGEAVELA
ncbi:MAG TPA: SDR family NAD(P)-dependent oxidoreductase [Allosphingosinicella sp.]|nr:SDR family NAD(P)-dependent oxidoreductase [Allosphingosinicella sp.]